MSRKTISLFILSVLSFLLQSCEWQENKNKNSQTGSISIESESAQQKPFVDSMSNPIIMKGTNIGCLFNAYYRTGQTPKMLELLDANTKKKFAPAQLNKLLQNLDYGYDMKLSGMEVNGNYKILVYSCLIQQTKVIKQLRVKIENDTARICPKNLAKGIIFQ